MITRADPALVLQAFLDDVTMTDLNPGGSSERMQIATAAELADLGDQMVVCTRCRTGPMTVRHLIFRHFVDTERPLSALRRPVEGPNTGLHRPGDFRVAYDGETYPARLAALPPSEQHWADRS